MPLYVRAGSILPLGPVKQYADEKVDGPLSISIYPGADASFLLYEDDGRSFNYRKGEWLGIQMTGMMSAEYFGCSFTQVRECSRPKQGL
jgi:alpha-glucosidase (family GH31 glycosyl hydrolase)